MSESEVEEVEVQLRFVVEAERAVAVLGAGENFILIDMSGGSSDRTQFNAALAESKARGFMLCGYLNAKSGVPGVCCYDPRGIITMTVAAVAWVHSIADYFREWQSATIPIRAGDSTEWLSRLHALPDTRAYGPN